MNTLTPAATGTALKEYFSRIGFHVSAERLEELSLESRPEFLSRILDEQEELTVFGSGT